MCVTSVKVAEWGTGWRTGKKHVLPLNCFTMWTLLLIAYTRRFSIWVGNLSVLLIIISNQIVDWKSWGKISCLLYLNGYKIINKYWLKIYYLYMSIVIIYSWNQIMMIVFGKRTSYCSEVLFSIHLLQL